MKKLEFAAVLLMLSLVVLISCNKDDEDEDPNGITNGLVSSVETGSAIEGAQIDLYKEDGELMGISLYTDAEGKYSVELLAGNYFARVYKQGYKAANAEGTVPIGFAVVGGETKTKDYQLETSDVLNAGWISGVVTSDGAAVQGVKVVVSDGVYSAAGLSNSDGEYMIYNVPEGASYSLRAWKQAYNSTAETISVTADTEVVKDMVMTNDATASLTGSVTFLATLNGVVDVTLIDKYSGLTIPGLSVMNSDNLDYTITGIPNGEFEAIASYMNDTYVLDPDWIAKNPGELEVTIPGDTEQNFSVTGAVTVNSPSNTFPAADPVEITELNPTFSWTAYSATKGYTLELSAENGEVIWGGLSGVYPNIVLEGYVGEVTSFVYPVDATALEVGRVYRWRVYANSEVQSLTQDHSGLVPGDPTTGWNFNSMSEDQMGLFKIVEE